MVDVDVRRAQRLDGKRRTLFSSTVKAHLRVLCAVGWVYQHWPVRGVPAFVTLKDGTIVAARSDEPQTSTNGGRTWDVPRRFCVHPQMEIVSIIRLNSGKLGAVVSRVEGIPNLGRDKENFRKMTLAFSTSSDEGATWSDLVQMNRYHTHGTPHVDTLIQTRTGRLILPVRTGFHGQPKSHLQCGCVRAGEW